MSQIVNQHFVNARYFHNLGYNITCLTGEGDIFYTIYGDHYYLSQFREQPKILADIRFKCPNYFVKNISNGRQTRKELENLNWSRAHGIGAILGGKYSEFAVIDIDGSSSNSMLKNILERLNLTLDYEWIVTSGNGYHIHFRTLLDSNYRGNLNSNFKATEFYKHFGFETIQIKARGHIVLPVSKHSSGVSYKFLNKKLPQQLPIHLGNKKLMRMISKFCDLSEAPLLEQHSAYYFDRKSPIVPLRHHGKSKEYTIVLDTETNGLPNDYNFSPSRFEDWPDLLQLAWQVYDSNFQLVKESNYYVRRWDYTMDPDAERITGITSKTLDEEGTWINDILFELFYDIANASLLIGHNLSYDISTISAAKVEVEKRGGKIFIQNIDPNIDAISKFCTMKSTTNLVGIPWNDEYKYPTLQELYNHFFNEDYSGAHDAMADVKATALCFKELLDNHSSIVQEFIYKE